MIEKIQVRQPRCGYRPMKWYLLREKGILVNHKKIRRIMNKYGLQAQIRRAFTVTTNSEHGYKVYPNLLAKETSTNIDQIWVADITYIRILTGFVYLAVIMDIYSRRIVGWALSKKIDSELTVSALKDAIEKRKPPADCIHHSDRGIQYASNEYVNLLKENGFLISMSRKGNPYDNAFAESFMKTLKMEEVYLWEYENFNDVVERIPFFIEEVYNKKRLHSGIGYLPPAEFEDLIQNGEYVINKISQSDCSKNKAQPVQL
jgi:transposase InsO family protein